MAQPVYQIQVLTPQGEALNTQVVHILVPAETGFIGVLANHAPYVTSSPGGRFEIRQPDGTERKFHAGPGFFEVAHNHASFLTQSFSEG